MTLVRSSAQWIYGVLGNTVNLVELDGGIKLEELVDVYYWLLSCSMLSLCKGASRGSVIAGLKAHIP